MLQAISVDKNLQTKLKGFKEITPLNIPSQGVTIEALQNWVSRLKQDTLQITEFKPYLIRGNVNLNTSKVLFLAIPFDKGWSAIVDGKARTIEKVDAGLIGILLEKGNHKVELSFEPPYTKEGTYISIFSLLLWSSGIVFSSRRKKKVIETINEEKEI